MEVKDWVCRTGRKIVVLWFLKRRVHWVESGTLDGCGTFVSFWISFDGHGYGEYHRTWRERIERGIAQYGDVAKVQFIAIPVVRLTHYQCFVAVCFTAVYMRASKATLILGPPYYSICSPMVCPKTVCPDRQHLYSSMYKRNLSQLPCTDVLNSSQPIGQ